MTTAPWDTPGRTVCGYLGAAEFLAELRAELPDAVDAHEPQSLHGPVDDADAPARLLLAPGPPRQVAWAHNVWRDVERLSFGSIGEAVKMLRARQRNWALLSQREHRRAALIQQQLPRFRAAPLTFPTVLPRAPLGSWTLLDRNTMLAAALCSSPFAHGETVFVQDREGPPSRAYQKLWEALTRLQRWPQAGERCLDLGAAPGGWTWAVARLGASVLAIDRAALADVVAALPNVECRRGDAFAARPDLLGPMDWLLSDVACYPQALYELVVRWIDADAVRNIVATIKLQGETDHASIARFASLPGAWVGHLSHNKHELTFVWCSDGARPVW